MGLPLLLVVVDTGRVSVAVVSVVGGWLVVCVVSSGLVWLMTYRMDFSLVWLASYQTRIHTHTLYMHDGYWHTCARKRWTVGKSWGVEDLG